MEPRPNDHVLVQAPNVADLSGVVESVRRGRVKIVSRSRFAPDGPWFESRHTMNVSDVTMIVRDGVLISNERKPRLLGGYA